MSSVVTRILGRSAGTLARQNLGANQPDRAQSAIKWAMVFVAIGNLPLTALLRVFYRQIVSFVSGESEFVRVASNCPIIIALGYVSLGVVQVLT